MKTCNKCNTPKATTEYKKDPRNKDGLQGICKECNKAWQQQRRDERAAGRIDLIAITDKHCNKCSTTKPVAEFYQDMGCADGYATICKACKNGTMAKWREENRPKYNANQRRLRAENPEWAKNTDLKRTHGITLEEYNQKKEAQDHVCAICEKPPQGKRPLVVDHNHETGQIRDLLCYGCNRALHVLEDAGLLEKCSNYLKKHK